MKRLLKIYLERPELAGVLLIAVLAVLFQIGSKGVLLGPENIRGLLGILPEVALVAIGVTILMICGEFDLSVGSVVGLTPMVTAVIANMGLPFGWAMLIGLLAAVAIGALNGLITLRSGIPSFITTLGMLFMARSLAVVISGGFPPLMPDDTPRWLFTDFFGPGRFFRLSFVWFLVIAVVLGVLLSKSNLGNWIKAAGGQRDAARALGVPVERVKLFCFMLCSLLAGFAGLLQVMRLNSAMPSTGEGMELQAIAAAVIGGTSLNGGIGTVFGPIVGALLIRLIDNGLVLSRMDPNWFKFAVGALIVVSVIFNNRLRLMASRLRLSQTMATAGKETTDARS